MKNKKIIVVIAAISILFISVGYALFSSNLNVSGTASASGEFDYSITCVPGLLNNTPDFFNSNNYKEQGYLKDSCSVDKNKVNIEVELEYPGATRAFTTKIVNTGTIPMKLDMDGFVTEGTYGKYNLRGFIIAAYKENSNENLNGKIAKLKPKESLYFITETAWDSGDSKVSRDFPFTDYYFDIEIPVEQDNS